MAWRIWRSSAICSSWRWSRVAERACSSPRRAVISMSWSFNRACWSWSRSSRVTRSGRSGTAISFLLAHRHGRAGPRAFRGAWIVGQAEEVIHGALEGPAELIEGVYFDVGTLAMFQLRNPALRDAELRR